MDAHFPLCDTTQAAFVVHANDEPWRRLTSTQTLHMVQMPTAPGSRGLSSVGKIAKFVILDNPALSGLDRLRKFKSWSDNWDAEGGRAPKPAVIDAATNIFSIISLYRVPSVALNAEGQPMLIFGAPINGEVVVTDVDKIDYFFAENGSPEGEDVDVSSGEMPQDLSNFLLNS